MKLDSEQVLLRSAQEAPATATSARASWRYTLPLTLLAIAVILATYRDTVASMVSLWGSNETYAHGYVIVPIVLALVWRKRHELALIAPRPDYLGFIFLAGAGFVWLVASAGQVQVLQQYAVVAMVPAAVVGLTGRRASSTIAFPLAFLFLAVPFGDAFLPRLMEWTADFTVSALRLTGIPVYREGTLFAVPSGRWSVVEACSGLRYLIASVTVGALFAYLSYQRWWKIALFMALSVAVPIFANFLRAYIIVMIGHLSDMKLAVGVDHFFYGWVFFGIVIALLFALGSFWRDPAPQAASSNITSAPVGSARAALASAFGIAVLATVWLIYAARLDGAGAAGTWTDLRSPVGVAGWSITADAHTDWQPRYVGAAASVLEVYRKSDRTVTVYLGHYRNQRQGSELINSENRVDARPRWMSVASVLRTEDFGRGPLELRQTRVLGPGARLLVWEWFRIGEHDTANPYAAKVLLARNKLLGLGDASAVTILAAPYAERPEEAAELLREFAREMRPSLEAAVTSVKQGNPQ
jgi:exosortase A